MAVKFRTMKELKEETSDVVRAAQRGVVVITSRGKPTMLLRRVSESELKGMLFLDSRKARRLLGKALADARAGPTTKILDCSPSMGRVRDSSTPLPRVEAKRVATSLGGKHKRGVSATFRGLVE